MKEDERSKAESRGPVKKRGENTGTSKEINLECCDMKVRKWWHKDATEDHQAEA